jgi:hypothetical protein
MAVSSCLVSLDETQRETAGRSMRDILAGVMSTVWLLGARIESR